MPLINSSSAIIAKAKSKYGQRLTEKDYKALVKLTGVSQIVLYLKSNTHYRDVLNKINENEVHRGQLEGILRQKLFYDFDSLCRYEMSVGSQFSQYIVRKYEIIQLIHFMTLFANNKSEEYIFALPSYFNKHTDIDLTKLSACNGFDSFLQALEKSPYKKILEKFRPDSEGNIDIASTEDALTEFSLTELYDAIKHCKSKKERAKLFELFDSINDYNNFSRIIRLKKYYSLPDSEIKKHLLPFGSLNKRTLEQMCKATDSSEVFEAVAHTSLGKKVANMHYNYEGEISVRARYNMCKSNMYFSTSPAVVMLSYMFVTEVELSNIINILEGARYSAPEEQIEKLLIYK